MSSGTTERVCKGRTTQPMAGDPHRQALAEGDDMAKSPEERQRTDAERIGDSGAGKLDADAERLAEEERRSAVEERERRREPSGA